MKNRLQRSILVMTSFAAALTATAALGKDDIPNRLFAGKLPPMMYPAAPLPVKDKLVPVPMEQQFFPVRTDGQPFVLNIDRTVNLTTAMNQFYYNPKWRGEEWSPFDQVDDIERATRLMGTWREYNEFSELRIFNGWHRFWEKWSGYGP